MTDVQLYLSIGVPSFFILGNMALSMVQLSGIRRELDAIRGDIRDMRTDLRELRTEVARQGERITALEGAKP